MAASQAGEWLQQFHKATSAMPTHLDAGGILADMEKLCVKSAERRAAGGIDGGHPEQRQNDAQPAEETGAVLRRC